MTGTIHSLAASIPGYCSSGYGVRTPSQWLTCARLGWHEPTTAAANAGYFAGHNIAPVLVVLILLAMVVAWVRGRGHREQPMTAYAATRRERRERAGTRR